MFGRILTDKKVFESVSVAPGGNGIEWESTVNLSAELLYRSGERSELRLDAIYSFLNFRTVDTSALEKLMNCSRQYINQLVLKGRLSPIRSESNNSLFLRSDIESEG